MPFCRVSRFFIVVLNVILLNVLKLNVMMVSVVMLNGRGTTVTLAFGIIIKSSPD